MRTLYQRVEAALKQDPSLVVKYDQVDQYLGFPVPHYNALGLHKSDLKRLERKGLAVRGYVPRNPVYDFIRDPKDPTGPKVKTMRKHSGYEVRYILVRYE